jgi:hypothetical protein
MNDARIRLRMALVCGLLSYVPTATFVPGHRPGLVLVFAVVTALYATLFALSGRIPRLVALVSLAFAVSGVFVWHGVAHVIVGLLSVAEAALGVSVLLAPRARNATPTL